MEKWTSHASQSTLNSNCASSIRRCTNDPLASLQIASCSYRVRTPCITLFIPRFVVCVSALPREISLAQFPHYHTPPPSHSLSAMPTRRSPAMLSICHMNTRNEEVREFQAIVETINANMNRMVKNKERQRLKAIGKWIILE